MEKFNERISLQNHLRFIEEKSMFGWEVVHIDKDEEYAYITFQRDPNMPHYQEIQSLENRYFSFDYPPMWPMFLFSILAFGLITALLVVWIMNKDNFDAKLWLLSLGLPAFICITLSTIWFAIRVSKMKKVLDTVDSEREKIKQELFKLKEGEKDENQSQDLQG